MGEGGGQNFLGVSHDFTLIWIRQKIVTSNNTLHYVLGQVYPGILILLF